MATIWAKTPFTVATALIARNANSEFSSQAKRSPIPKDIIELTIDSLSYNGGRGVGRYDGLVVFVPGTAPQDIVRVRITSKRAKFWEGELVEVLKPSLSRREPPCLVANRCGGCSWQHVNYPEQVEQKKKILAASLRPLNKIAQWEWLPFAAAPEEFHYRNRVQVQIRGGKKGFFAKRTNDLVETDQCLIADEAINVKLKNLKIEDGVNRVELTMKDGADFSQVNEKQNLKLKELVLDRIAMTPDWLMDLYSGSGNITLPLAEKFKDVPILAVEMSETAVARGRAQSQAKIEWQAGDVGKVLAKTAPRRGRGVIVLDPPRSGCTPDVIAEILRHSPKQIVYVSCNPTTFSRDAVKLVESGAYKLENVQGLDMFPQTEHVELIASLCSAT
ncbi:MAG: class I SAM-dependent RNA methyltransferase [Bdellovibrionales bacterium]